MDLTRRDFFCALATLAAAKGVLPVGWPEIDTGPYTAEAVRLGAHLDHCCETLIHVDYYAVWCISAGPSPSLAAEVGPA